LVHFAPATQWNATTGTALSVDLRPEARIKTSSFLSEHEGIGLTSSSYHCGTMTATPPIRESLNDLGLGTRLAGEHASRFINRDGSFNVEREGLSLKDSLSPYHALLTMSWTRFYLLVAVSYFVTNLFFAVAYMCCGTGALEGVRAQGMFEQFLETFFFSVQTLATIGYGRMSPNGLAANMVVSLEALVGLMGFALATGLLFARFSRPVAHILFSERAVVAPFREGTALMFRIANKRSTQLIDVGATVVLGRMEDENGKQTRKFYPLKLDRRSVAFFPLHWTVVHPINQESPLYGITEEQFHSSDAEVMIMLSAVDETFSTTVHARSSYKSTEVEWGVKFADMFLPMQNGKPRADMSRLHNTERA
jgi:inward rectifier potassium channel